MTIDHMWYAAGLSAFLCNAACAQSLPVGWLDQPFGRYTLGLEGGSWFDAADTATVTGEGLGFGNAAPGADGGRFFFKRLRGDCELVADVPLLDNALLGSDARTGVMLRDSADRHDCYVALLRQPGTAAAPGVIRFHYRNQKGSSSGSLVPVSGVSQGLNYLTNYVMPAVRLRLVRKGASLAGYLSTNDTGTAWFKAFDRTQSMNEDLLAGLLVSRGAAVQQMTLITNTFGNITVRELVSAERNAAGDRRIVSWATDLPDAPADATCRLSYATSYTGAFTALADNAVPPFETAADWMVGTSLYFRVEYVTGGGTSLLGTSGACALRLPQPARAAPTTNGLWTAYYSPTNALLPLAERIEPGLADNWTNAVPDLPANDFRVVFNGSVTPEASGLYVFGSEADDTLRLTLDTREILSDIYPDSNGKVSVSSPVWLEAGRCYGFMAEYTQFSGDKTVGLQWARQDDTALTPIPAACLSPFPTPWAHQDIGATDVGGYADYNPDAARFTVAGAGTGLTGTADSFRYAWREQRGDFDFSMRVQLAADNAADATAGLMLRLDASDRAAHAGIYLTRADETAQIEVRARTESGKSVQTVAAGPSFAKQDSVRLRVSRMGGTLAFACRAEGADDWTDVAQVSLPLPATVLLGMAAASQDAAQPAAALFDNTETVLYTPTDLLPAADTYAQNGDPDRSFGTAGTLHVKRSDDAVSCEAFLLFDARGYAPVRSATLKLYVVTNNVALSRESVAFRKINDHAWQEPDATWNHSPAGLVLPSAYLDPLDPLALGTASIPGTRQWVELDVTAALNQAVAADGRLALGISSLIFNTASNARPLEFASKEYSAAEFRPRLAIVPAAPQAPSVRLGGNGTETALAWPAFADATAYRVWRATAAGFTQISGDLAGLMFADTGLSAGTLYRYAVSAVTPQGETPLSLPAAVVAAAQTDSLEPLADATVQGGVNRETTYGGTTTVGIKNENFQNRDTAREAFIRFDTEGLGGVERAVLVLTASSAVNDAVARSLDIRLAPDSDWDETTVSYANPPSGVTLPTANRTNLPADGSVLRTAFGAITSGAPYTFDITEMVRAAARTGTGKLTLGLNRTDLNTSFIMTFHSKNATAANNRPKLLVSSIRPGAPAATAAPGGASVSWPAFRGALSYTVRRADTRDGTYAVVAQNLTRTTCTAAATSGWFTVSAMTANGETPASDAAYAQKTPRYEARPPLADTCVESNTGATNNYGQSATFTLKAPPSTPTREQFFRFDATGLERAASARFRLNLSASGGFTPSSILVYDEAAGEWNECAVTWTRMIPGLTVPCVNTASRGANELARVPYPVNDANRLSFIEADVTEAVRAAAAQGRMPTFRVCGDSTSAGSTVMWSTASKEYAGADRRPALLADTGLFGAPTGAQAVRDEANRAATLTWTAVPGAASYTVRRTLPGGGYEDLATGLTATAWAVSNLWSNGTRYTYEVIAVDADGTPSETAQIPVLLDGLLTRPILDDTFIRGGSYSNAVYGADATFQVKRDGSEAHNREAYLRLDVGGLPAFERAALRLRAENVGDTGMFLVAQTVADTGWAETGDTALTWANAPVKMTADPAPPLAGELGRASLAGLTAGATFELDVTDGLSAWRAQNPGAESVVVRLFSNAQSGDGLKSVTFTAEEGACLPEDAPAMVYTFAAYPPGGTVLLLK
jgi:hypothetical protein